MLTIRHILSIWHFLLIGSFAFGQGDMVIRPATDIENLVETGFIQTNECIEVFNIEAIGRLESIGSFSNGSSSILMEEGIVFSTGFLDAIGNSNTNSQLSGQLYGPAQAPYIQEAVKNPITMDAVGIEFDFIPNQRLVNFNYIFASEEYCEYVGSAFNDAFGFFISGPGIEGDGFDNSVNIAKVPEQEDVVSINNINHAKNQNFYINNVPPNDAEMCGFNAAGTRSYPVEFDGFTRRLQAIIEVIPCETYHIRLVVADIGDDLVDSAVFLEGKSFQTNAGIKVDARVKDSEDLVVYENCLEGTFLFTKSRFISNEAVSINFIVEGTATLGTDYELLQDTVTFDANSFNETLPIRVIPDNVAEGRETIKIILETVNCDCIIRDTAILYIDDPRDDLGITFEDPVVCLGQAFTIGPTLESAVQPIRYLWNTGDTSSTITVVNTTAETYNVVVQDFCGIEDSAQVTTSFQAIPELSIQGAFDWCPGRAPETIALDLPGQAPWSIQYTVDEGPIVLLEGIDTNPYMLALPEAGIYNFVGFNDEYCTGVIEGQLVVDTLPFDIELASTTPSCLGANDGSIALTIIDGIAPFAIDWGMNNEQERTLKNLLAGDYKVVVMDSLGCTVSDSIQVEAASIDADCQLDLSANLYIPNAFTPNGDSVNDLFTIYPKYGIIKHASFRIYNRWGGLVFESTQMSENQDEQIGWDGKDHQAGLYTCVAILELVNGRLQAIAQDVTLLH